MRELIIAVESEFESNAEAFDGHDGYGADKRANGDVDQWCRTTIFRRDSIDHDE